MRGIIFSVGFVVVVILGAIISLALQTDPQEQLWGEWELVHHRVEKAVRRPKVNQLDYSIGHRLSPHQCERWTFDTQNGLSLIDPSGKRIQAGWSLKSRGDLLEITGLSGVRDLTIEYLDHQKMVLYYHSDLQIRGVVKMTLRKVSGL